MVQRSSVGTSSYAVCYPVEMLKALAPSVASQAPDTLNPVVSSTALASMAGSDIPS